LLCKELKDPAEHVLKKNMEISKKFSQEKNTIRTSVADQDPGTGMIDQDHIF
jgi:hypothetical protein